MATGRKAFEGKTQVSVIAAILEHEPAPLRDLQPLTPPAFEHLVTACLSKSPDDRWQTARDVATQLRWIAAAGGAQPAAPPTAPLKRRRWAMWGAAALMAAVLLAGGFLATRYMNDSQPRQVMRFEIPTPPITAGQFMTMMALSPDGRSLAFILAEGGATIPTLWIRRIDSVAAEKIAGTEGAVYPFWSADSRYIGFAALGRLKRIDVSGCPPQTICEIPPGNFFGGAWNADGVIVFGGASPLMRVSASGGRPVPLTTLDSSAGERGHGWPTFLPDGRHLLFMAAPGGQPWNVKAVALDSPKPKTVLAANSRPLYSPTGHLLFHRDGTLMAQRFDAATQTLSGEPARVADGLAFAPNGAVAATVSDTGLLATRSGAAFEPTQLTWFDLHGARLGVVGDQAVYRGLGLSPDNQYVAVHIHQEPSGGDVWVIDLQRGSSTRYTFNAHNFAPSWSHDGKYVMFSSDREGSGLNLYRKPAGAAGGDEMMLGSGTAAFVEDLTPDGKWMVYGAATPNNGIDIMRVPLTEKGDPQTVVSTPFFDGLSKISPDGRWIAYESDESGRREIYAQPYPSGTAKWQISTDGGRYVRWSPKGNELFYLKDDGTMMGAEVHAQGDALVANTPKPLFKTNPLLANHRGSALDIPYDVSRDGQRFLVNERIRTAESRSPISVVVNWPALLKR
jgi:hypothetical protein